MRERFFKTGAGEIRNICEIMNDTTAAVSAGPHGNPCYFSPLSSHPLLGHLPAFRKDPLAFLASCLQTGADVVPLRLPLVSAFLLLNPDDIERVLVTEHRQFLKPLWLRTPAVRRLLGRGLVTSDGDSWRAQRRACQPAFHPSLLPGYGRTVSTLTGQMLDGWTAEEPRRVLRDMTRLTVEIVGQTLLGVNLGPVSGEISAIMATLMECFNARGFGLLPLPPALRELRAIRRLDRLVDTLIAEGLAADTNGKQTLLTRLHTEPGGTAGTHGLREQVKTFLAAGHDSSSLTLTWALLMLATHPEAADRLAAELASVLKGRAPMPEDVPHLPCTQAVIKETLRLYPPLWMMGRQAVQPCKIGGVAVPAGALILTSPWPVQRLARFFPDPERFKPERWEGNKTASLPRCAFFPFGGGPRVCIGQGFALLEATLILATVAQRFRLETVEQADIRPWITMTLRPPADLRMRLTLRDFREG